MALLLPLTQSPHCEIRHQGTKYTAAEWFEVEDQSRDALMSCLGKSLSGGVQATQIKVDPFQLGEFCKTGTFSNPGPVSPSLQHICIQCIVSKAAPLTAHFFEH